MHRLARIITKHPVVIIIAVGLLTAVLGWYATGIIRRVDLEENLPRNSKRVSGFHEFREKYGNGNSLAIIVTAPDLFSPGALAALDRLTRGLLDLGGIKAVTSLTNLTEFRGDGDTLRSGPLMDSIPRNAKECRALRARLLADPWYNGRLISADGRYTILAVTLAKTATLEQALAVLKRIRAFVADHRGPLTATFAGSLVMDEQIDRALGRDVAILFPLVMCAIALVLWLSFRNYQGVVLPLATVAGSVLWTLGLMAALGRPLSLVNNIMPVLLIGVGSAYGIHIVARYHEQCRHGLEKVDALRATIESTGFGVWMAAITTVAGFASLALSKIQMIRDFGIFSALGVAVAFLISIVFIPAVLQLLPVPRLKRQAGTGGGRAGRSLTGRCLAGLTGFCVRHPAAAITLAAVVLGLSLAGWPRLRATFDFAEFLPRDSEQRQAEKLVDEKFGGSAELEVLVQGDLNDPAILAGIARLQRRMESMGISRPIAITDLLARVNRAFHGGDRAFEVLPADPAALPQYLFLLSISATPEELSQFVTFDMQEARISGRISNVMSTADRARLIGDLERTAASIMGEGAKVTVTGMPVIELAMMDLIQNEQMQNILSSLAAVFCLVIAAFRSLAAGLICLTPIALTIVYCFGLMGWIGVPLNAATATMASLATGMGVDYSIHFCRRYTEEREGCEEAGQACIATARTTGATIVANALAVGAGFAILLLSGLPIFRGFGSLIALTMVLTAFGALTVVPALLSLGRGIMRRGARQARSAGG